MEYRGQCFFADFNSRMRPAFHDFIPGDSDDDSSGSWYCGFPPATAAELSKQAENQHRAREQEV